MWENHGKNGGMSALDEPSHRDPTLFLSRTVSFNTSFNPYLLTSINV